MIKHNIGDDDVIKHPKSNELMAVYHYLQYNIATATLRQTLHGFLFAHNYNYFSYE